MLKRKLGRSQTSNNKLHYRTNASKRARQKPRPIATTSSDKMPTMCTMVRQKSPSPADPWKNRNKNERIIKSREWICVWNRKMSTATCPRPRSRGRNICTVSLAVLSGRRVPPLKRRENPRGVREDRVRLGKRRAICYGHTHVKHDDRYRFQAFLRQPGCGKTGKSIRMTPPHPCHVPFCGK